MRSAWLPLILALIGTLGPATADEAAGKAQQPVDAARHYIDAFVAGDMQTLLDHASPELKQLMKDAATAGVMRDQTVGKGAKSADEEISVTYTRQVKSAGGKAFAIMAQVASDGQLVAFSIQPAGEAPSEFLDYQTKAKLRLPFDGTWTVGWGGRTIKQNQHASSPGQRFAYDILQMRDGASHAGDGGKNEDYYCFGQPILAPGAGRVVAAVDGIADNIPSQTNPAKLCGNHVILDLGHDEFLFLAHLQKGSVKVKPGERVAAGRKLGLCGNSGNSSEPHLHVHLQTTADLADGKGLPLQFQHYQSDGQPVDRGEPTKGQQVAVAAVEEGKAEANRAAIKAARAGERGEQTQPTRPPVPNDMLAQASQEPEKAIDVPAEALQKLVGSYELAPGLLATVEALDGKLMIGLMGQPPQQVFARSETVWFVQGVDATFTFNVGKDGNVDSLVLAQKQTFKRTKGVPAKGQQIAPVPGQEGKPEAKAAADPDADKPAIDAKHRRRLVGRYQLKPDFIFDVRDVDGRLMVGITNQVTQEVFPDSPTRWSYRGIKATIEFKLGKTGPAKSLVLIQNGAEQTAYRMKK